MGGRPDREDQRNDELRRRRAGARRPGAGASSRRRTDPAGARRAGRAAHGPGGPHRARDDEPGALAREPRRPALRRSRRAGQGRPLLLRRPRRPLRAVRRQPDPRRHPRRAAQHRLGLPLGAQRRGRELDQTRTRLANSLGRAPENAEVAAEARPEPGRGGRQRRGRGRAPTCSPAGRSSTETSFAEVLASSDPDPSPWSSTRSAWSTSATRSPSLPERLQAVVQGYFLAERPMAEPRRRARRLGVADLRRCGPRRWCCCATPWNSALDPELVPAHPRPDGCAAQRRDAYFRAVAARHSATRRSVSVGFEAAG